MMCEGKHIANMQTRPMKFDEVKRIVKHQFELVISQVIVYNNGFILHTDTVKTRFKRDIETTHQTLLTNVRK